MIDNEILKVKLKKELRNLNISNEQENALVRELNFLSDLLIEVYIKGLRGSAVNDTNVQLLESLKQKI